ncbi:MAG TPA: plastocyanin/azurin family copper-binding protein [Nitrososphaeraceae archaeon]|nr:plastocyanin/azurin family copper-binding protein [Nitrososphaeraceae archaeon]
MKQREDNDKIAKSTYPVIASISIACLLILSSVLQSAILVFSAPIISQTAFAQQQQKSSKVIIPTVKSLLNKTINEYRKQNFTGAQNLATGAYLDNFEFIEAPLEKHDKALKENTEIMLREQLRQAIKDKSPIEGIQQLINNINSNLDKAKSLLANESSIQTIESESTNATAINQTNQQTTSSSTASNATEVRIIGDEVKEPYMPGSIIIQAGDKVRWINADKEEAHTVTSGFENSTDKGKLFDSGLLNANQTVERTFDKAGTYGYYCTLHPIMAGVVNVN